MKINKLARRMNFAQQFFCILFAVFYGALLAVNRDFGPFDTAAIWAERFPKECGGYILVISRLDYLYASQEIDKYRERIEEILQKRPATHRLPVNHIWPGIAWSILSPIFLFIFTKSIN